MNYKQIESRQDLALYFDRLVDASNAMIKKTAPHNHTCESLVRTMLAFVDSGDLFLLIGEEGGEFQGFIMGLLIRDTYPWLEHLALWTKPGVGVACRDEAFQLMCGWARVQGAHRINTTITRSPDLFFKMFHEPLGFKKIGYILEKEL